MLNVAEERDTVISYVHNGFKGLPEMFPSHYVTISEWQKEILCESGR